MQHTVRNQNVATAAGSEFEPAPERWRILSLLLISAAMNYIDRGTLFVAAPALTQELSFSPAQMGLLFSSFFWSYAGFLIVAGWLADRYQVGSVLGAGYFVWSLTTVVMGFVSGLQALLLLRLLMGLGQSVSFPVYSRVIAEKFPINQRGLPNAMIDAAVKVGPALSTLVGGVLVARYGWRTMFIVLGGGGLLWLLPWYLWAPQGRSATNPKPVEGPSILQICQRRDAWGTFVGNFCANYGYYFLLTWLPSYLVTERHLSMRMMAVLASLPFWASATASLLAGWTADRWIRRGASPTRARKMFVVSGLTFATLMFPAAIVTDLGVSVVLLVGAYCAFGFFSSNHWAITQTLAGQFAAGKWTGLQNGISNTAGVIAPLATGLIVSRTGNYYLAFLSASVILLVGAVCYLLVVGDVAPLRWCTEMPKLAKDGFQKRQHGCDLTQSNDEVP
jgi:MFS family permease